MYGYVGGNPLRYIDILGLKSTCKYVVTNYYNKTSRELVKPELGYWIEICIPMPKPGPGYPLPGRRPNFPDPLDVTFTMECRDTWIKTQDAEWKIKTERWMSGYLKCIDDCTGEKENFWMEDRLADDFPRF